MRIGEVAEAVGVTRRAVRHYHHLMETAAPPAGRERLLAALDSLLESPEAVARVDEAYALLDALAECTPRELLPDSAAIDHGRRRRRAAARG